MIFPFNKNLLKIGIAHSLQKFSKKKAIQLSEGFSSQNSGSKTPATLIQTFFFFLFSVALHFGKSIFSLFALRNKIKNVQTFFYWQ